MTAFYRRNSQAQSPGHFRNAEIFNVSQQDDISIFFREADEGGTQLSTGLASLVFAQRRVIFVGNGQFRERQRSEPHDPRRGAFSPPLPGLIQSNLNQPCPETGFKSKLRQFREGLKGRLLDDVLDLWVAADCCPDYP
jgi:hypothetical protein